jgi:hypothetical protein
MKTTMQELKSDLLLTKETTKNSFLEIENQEIRKVCIGVVEITLNAIIKRIDTELLEMEKEQIIEARATARRLGALGGAHYLSEAQQYYNETFKSE